jgi:lipopolysaccharide/colanic/teichoic acid biosynthesis glycosyltransferase
MNLFVRQRTRPVLLLLALLAALVAPLILDVLRLEELAGREPFRNSVIAGCLGAAVAVVGSSRVSSLPGVSSLAIIIPSYALSILLVLAWFLVTRLPYSNVFLGTSFAAALAASLLYEAFRTHRNRLRLYLVPGGRIDRLADLGGIDLRPLARPELPDDPLATIVADLHFDLSPEWEGMLAQAALLGVPVYHYKSVWQSLTGRVQIEHLSENIYGSLLPNLGYLGIKRIGDTLGTLLLLPVMLPLFAVVAVCIRVDSPGPVFFRQRRIGYRGTEFSVVKFRTMRVSTERVSDARQASMTRENDERITRVGRFLRRTRIDELPQLINVLRGEMSWIGPRPEARELAEWYEAQVPFYAYRHIVRPGVSGWAQVNQGHVTDVQDISRKLQYDFFYIANFSYWLDALIAVRSLAVVFTGYGAR